MTTIIDSDNATQHKSQTMSERAQNLLIKGKRLSQASKSYNPEATLLISRAIKLDPYLTNAWIELADCYQKNSDLDGAISCLENALEFSSPETDNKLIFRKLSACIRQKPNETRETRIMSLLRSLELSKQALKLDLHDKKNYYNLAKAYMCLFFATECVDHQLIHLSRAAYIKALSLSEKEEKLKGEGDPKTIEKPFIDQSDFLFNYSTVLLYLQEFPKALEYLKRAVQLDPDWSEPKRLEEGLEDYLKQIVSLTSELTRNSKKTYRRYAKIFETLKSTEKIDAAIQLDQQRLRQSSEIRVKPRPLKDIETMSREENEDENVTVLHLKLINTVNYNQAMYLTFIAIDQSCSVIVVTIYNLSIRRCPSPRDIITIVRPRVELVKIDNLKLSPDDDTPISYKRINVPEFKDFYVNGHRVSIDQVSKPQFTVSLIP